jgi:hypothetical protein
MTRRLPTAAALLLVASGPAFAGSAPQGPAAGAVRKWFTTDRSLNCYDRKGNDSGCRFNSDADVEVKYAPSGDEAVAFATYINDPTGNAQQFAVAVFRKDGGGWRFVRNADRVLGQEPSNVAFRGGKVEFDTATMRDSDSRCCPTGRTHWSVPLR